MNEEFAALLESFYNKTGEPRKYTPEQVWERAQKEPEYAKKVHGLFQQSGVYQGDFQSLYTQKKKGGQPVSSQPSAQPTQPSAQPTTPDLNEGADRSGQRPQPNVGQYIYGAAAAQGTREITAPLREGVDVTRPFSPSVKDAVAKEREGREVALSQATEALEAQMKDIEGLRRGLEAMESGEITASPEERNAAVGRYNEALRLAKAEQLKYQDIYDGYRRTIAKTAFVAKKEQKEKEGQGTWAGAFWNKWLTQDLPSMAGGYAEFFTKYGPYAVQSGAFVIPGMAEEAGKEAYGATKEYLSKVADPTTTEEYASKLLSSNFGFEAAAAILNPAMLTAMVDRGAGFGAQSYYKAKREMEEVAAGLPPEERQEFIRDGEGIALASAGVEMALEKIGLDEIISPSLRRIVNARVLKRMGEAGTKVGAREFSDIVESEARTLIDQVRNRTLSAAGAALGEFPTEGLNSIAQDEMRQAYNAVKGKDIFDEKTQKEILMDGIYSAALGAVGGAGMNVLITTATNDRPSQEDFQGAMAFLSELPSIDFVGQDLAARVKSGKMSKEDADATLQTISDYKSAVDALPEDISNAERVEAVKLIRQRRGVEQKMAKADPAFKARYEKEIGEINGKLLAISLGGKPQESTTPVAEPTEQVLKDQEAVMAARPEGVAAAQKAKAEAEAMEQTAMETQEVAEGALGAEAATIKKTPERGSQYVAPKPDVPQKGAEPLTPESVGVTKRPSLGAEPMSEFSTAAEDLAERKAKEANDADVERRLTDDAPNTAERPFVGQPETTATVTPEKKEFVPAQPLTPESVGVVAPSETPSVTPSQAQQQASEPEVATNEKELSEVVGRTFIRKALAKALAKAKDIKQHQKIATDIVKRVLFGDNVSDKDLKRIAKAALKITENPMSLLNFAVEVNKIKERSQRGAQIATQRKAQRKLKAAFESRSTTSEVKELIETLLANYEEDAATSAAWIEAANAIIDLRAPTKDIPDLSDIKANVDAAKAAAEAKRQQDFDDYAETLIDAYGMSAQDANDAAEFIINGRLSKRLAEKAVALQQASMNPQGVSMTLDDAIKTVTDEWIAEKKGKAEDMMDILENTVATVLERADEFPKAAEALRDIDLSRLTFQDRINVVRFARSVLSGDMEGGIDYVRMLRDAQRMVAAPQPKSSGVTSGFTTIFSTWAQSLVYHLGKTKQDAFTALTNLGFDGMYQMRNLANNTASKSLAAWSIMQTRLKLLGDNLASTQMAGYSLLNAYESYDPKQAGTPEEYFKSVIDRMRKDADTMEKSGVMSLKVQAPYVRQVADQMEAAGSRGAYYNSLPSNVKQGIQFWIDEHAKTLPALRKYFVGFLNKPFKEAPNYLSLKTVGTGAPSRAFSVTENDVNEYFEKRFRSPLSQRSESLLERDTPINQWDADNGRVIDYDFGNAQYSALHDNLTEALVAPEVNKYLHIRGQQTIVDNYGGNALKLYDMVIRQMLGTAAVQQQKLRGLTESEVAAQQAAQATASFTAYTFFASAFKAILTQPIVFLSTVGQLGGITKAAPAIAAMTATKGRNMNNIMQLATIPERNAAVIASRTFGVGKDAVRSIPGVGRAAKVFGNLSIAAKTALANRVKGTKFEEFIANHGFRDSIFLFFLKQTDRVTAVMSWKMAYISYWQQQGENVDDAFLAKKNQEAAEGKVDPGVTYADGVVQRDQGVNTLDDRSRLYTEYGFVAKNALPFSSFGVTKAVTNAGNLMKMFRGGAATKEATTELAYSTLGDGLIYGLSRYYLLSAAWGLLQATMPGEEEEESEMDLKDARAEAYYRKSQLLTNMISQFLPFQPVQESVAQGMNYVYWVAYNNGLDPTEQLSYEDFYNLGLAPYYVRMAPKSTGEAVKNQFVAWLGGPFAVQDAYARYMDAYRGYYKDAYGNIQVIPIPLRDDYKQAATAYLQGTLVPLPILTDRAEAGKMRMRTIRGNTIDPFEAVRLYQLGEDITERPSPENITKFLPPEVIKDAQRKYGDTYVTKLYEQYLAGARRAEKQVVTENYKGEGTLEGSIRMTNPELYERLAKPLRETEVRRPTPKVRGIYLANIIDDEMKRYESGKNSKEDMQDLLLWIEHRMAVMHESTREQEEKALRDAIGEENLKKAREILDR